MTGTAAAYAANDAQSGTSYSGVLSYSGNSSLQGAGSWDGHKSSYLRFNGSSGFSGYTSSAGSHSHSMSLNNTGSNAAHNNISRRCSMS